MHPRLKYHIAFYVLAAAVVALMPVGASFAMLVWMLAFFVIPIAAWRVGKNRVNQTSPGPRLRIFLFVSNVLIFTAWLSSALLVYLLVALTAPWPLSEYQHYVVKQDLIERGFIPKNARDVLVKDDHGGFHGDGYRFVTYEYQQNRIEELKPIPNFIQREKLRGSVFEWQNTPFDERAIASLKVLDHFDIPEKYRPNLSSPSLRYYCDNTADYREYHCGHLYLHDAKSKRFWYINITV